MGLKSANERFKKQAEQQEQRSYIRQLKLGEGEKAWFRFLSTGEDDDYRLQDYYAHPYQDDNGRFVEAFCTMDEPGGVCSYCLAEKPKTRFGVWVWVNYVLRKRQNPQLEDAKRYPNAKAWKKVRYRDELYYQQPIDDVRMFTRGPGKGRYLWNQLIRHAEDFGTLMDRDYLMSCTGTKVDTTYTITPTDETAKLTEKQMEAYRELPSVTDVISGRKTWPPRDQKVEITDDDDVEELAAPALVNVVVSDRIEAVDDLEDDNGVEELEAIRPAMGNKTEVDKAIEMALSKISGDDEEDE